MYHAIKKNNLADLQQCVTAGNVNISNDDGYSPLTLAIKSKFLPGIELLLGNGANVNLIDGNGRTPLTFALKSKFLPAVELLLAQNADVNLCDSRDGVSPLTYAIGSKVIPAVELLLTKGALIEDQDICLAAQSGLPAMLELFLCRGGNIEARGRKKRTPLWYAVESESLETVQLLLDRGANIHAISRKNNILFEAIRQRSLPIIHLLLARGADPNHTPKGGLPLMATVCVNFDPEDDVYAREVLMTLIQAGADPNTVINNFFGYSVLIHCILREYKEVVMEMLARGANPNLCCQMGKVSPLMFAAISPGNVDIMQALLERGADIDYQAEDGTTALGAANTKGIRDAIQFLLNHK